MADGMACMVEASFAWRVLAVLKFVFLSRREHLNILSLLT